MFKNILIPTDGSSLSLKAAAHGVQIAKSLGAKVTAFFAAPPATPVVYRNNLPAGFAQPEEHRRMIERTAAKHLDAIGRLAKKARVRFEAVHVTSDYPAEAILKAAAKQKCDLIVMATRGQGGLRGVLIGSVAQQVLNKSKPPVLVLRLPPGPEQQTTPSRLRSRGGDNAAERPMQESLLREGRTRPLRAPLAASTRCDVGRTLKQRDIMQPAPA